MAAIEVADALASGATRSGERRFPSFWQRLLRNRPATVGLVVLGVIGAATTLAPLFVDANRVTMIDLVNLHQPPSLQHPLGTDELGRDVFVRVLYGGRISLLVGVGAAVLRSIIGIIVGGVAGYFGGWLDTILMRLTDMVIGLPYFFLLILFATLFRPSVLSLTLMLALFQWTTMARLVRGEFQALRDRDFVLAARATGRSKISIMSGEILPNAMGPIIVQFTIGIAFAILAESSISYLGLGIQPPTPSWGNMLSNAQGYLFLAPWLAVIPGFLIFATVISFNFVGDGLRDALDPKLRR